MYRFKASIHLHAERSASRPSPRGHPVLASDVRVEDVAGELDQPCRNGVIHRDTVANSPAKAYPQCSKQSSDGPYAHLRPAVGLGVIWLTVFSGDALEVLHLTPQDTQRLLN